MGRIIPNGELLGFWPILACITVPNNSPWGIFKAQTLIIPHVKKIKVFFRLFMQENNVSEHFWLT